jgi:outer membrane biosynthesis protein TonB
MDHEPESTRPRAQPDAHPAATQERKAAGAAPTPAADPAVTASRPRRPLALLAGAAVLLFALSWTALHALRASRDSAPPAQVSAEAPPAPPMNPPPVAPPGRPASVVSTSSARSVQPAAAALSATVHEEIPDVPRHARQTIRGHLRVSIRVIVDREGKVLAALADQPGPSRYFERLSIEAAKKWTFPAADTEGRRLELVRFVFTRNGTTGRAVAIR